MKDKQYIIDAIRETARENGGKPLGVARFRKETGITDYEWQMYWPRFSEAQKAAGFIPNQLQGAYSDDFVIEKAICAIRKLDKFPTRNELNLGKDYDKEFPNRNVFARFGPKRELAKKIIEYCAIRSGFDDVAAICQQILEKSSVGRNIQESNFDQKLGEVYLFKSGRYYKIGKTNDVVRRGREIRIQLPERTELIHSIKTDDPNGVEAYWHNRFEAKRKLGEWFDLGLQDVKAFKRWKRIY